MTDTLIAQEFNFDSPRSAMKPVGLPRLDTSRHIGSGAEPFREKSPSGFFP